MVFKIVISEPALGHFYSYLDYVVYGLENFQAAVSIQRDYADTLERLANTADGRGILDDPDLARFGYRKIHLKHHRLILIYRIEGKTVYIDGIYHTLQDYENLFKTELGELD